MDPRLSGLSRELFGTAEIAELFANGRSAEYSCLTVCPLPRLSLLLFSLVLGHHQLSAFVLYGFDVEWKICLAFFVFLRFLHPSPNHLADDLLRASAPPLAYLGIPPESIRLVMEIQVQTSHHQVSHPPFKRPFQTTARSAFWRHLLSACSCSLPRLTGTQHPCGPTGEATGVEPRIASRRSRKFFGR